MNRFCPDGYVSTQEAIVRAAAYWFPARFAALDNRSAALESAAAPHPKSDSSLDAAVRAFSHRPIPAAWQDDTWRHEFGDVCSQTAHRLRNFLHRGTLKAYYFRDDGCHHLSREFWATAQANGVIESGICWPFGAPTNRRYERRPNYSLFMKESDSDLLLTEQPDRKRPLPESKFPDLVAAMRSHNDSPNRKEQREVVRKLPEFERYHITDAVFAKLRGRCRATSVASLPIGSNKPGKNRGDNRGAKFRAP